MKGTLTKYMMSIRYILLSLAMLAVSCCVKLAAQNTNDSTRQKNAKVTLVYLENCETLSFDEANLPETQVLKGNVRFRHDSALLYCDSAYFYEKRNSLDAFGNVKIVQADTLVGYGDKLYYDGNRKMARFRKNVRLEDGKMTLYTDSLNYDRLNNIAYYYKGGKLCDSINTLTSVWGQYLPELNRATFKNNVILENPDFRLESDTLNYNTSTNVADIVGPTKMKYREETDIFSTNGWYNTQNDQSMLLDRSLIVHKDGKSITGDTIYYDKRKQFGTIYHNMQLTDSIQKTTLCGHYGYYDEAAESGMATDSALLIDWSSPDSLFLHADSMFTRTDTAKGNIVRAYYKVRMYKSDVQAVCDSLTYIEKDSVMSLYNEPVMWNENQQISATLINVYLNDSTVDYAHLVNQAFVARQVDSISFDQMSGKEIFAFMKDGEIYKVDVSGNAETVFYPKEDDGNIIGINKTQSSYVTIFIENRKISKVLLTAASNGTMFPLGQLPKEDTYLGGFFWAEQERPKSPLDIFNNPPRTPRPDAAATAASASASINK